MIGLLRIYRGDFGGWKRLVRPTAIPEIGQIVCLECDGTGDWPYHPELTDLECVTCKGTGLQYVS